MLRTVLLVSFLLVGSLGARADTSRDCVQDDDLELRVRACTAIIERGGKISWAIFNRGLAYNKTSRFELAVADFSRYIRLLPKDATGYNDRGNAYLRLNKEDLAIKDYQKAIDLDPKYALARNNIGEAYENLNKLDAR
jgi:Flp pilus assembly protein TadD